MRRRSKDPYTHSSAGSAVTPRFAADGEAAEDQDLPRQSGPQRPLSSGNRLRPRLGALEYTLLALILISIAVTLALALINPSH